MYPYKSAWRSAYSPPALRSKADGQLGKNRARLRDGLGARPDVAIGEVHAGVADLADGGLIHQADEFEGIGG